MAFLGTFPKASQARKNTQQCSHLLMSKQEQRHIVAVFFRTRTAFGKVPRLRVHPLYSQYKGTVTLFASCHLPGSRITWQAEYCIAPVHISSLLYVLVCECRSSCVIDCEGACRSTDCTSTCRCGHREYRY